jgi:hypothetical protein
LDPAEDSISTAASRTEQSSSTPLDEGEVTDVITSAETNVTTFAPPDAGLSGESSETTPSHASTASVPDAGEAWPSCAFTLTHSSEPGRIDARASVACLGGEGHEDSGYLRTFDLAAFGITHFRVTELRVGVEAAYAGPEQAGVQTVISRIYSTASDPPAAASLMLLESRAFDVADTQRSTIAIPMTAAMDATSGPYLVAEVFTPRLNGNRFFLGANAASESDESYLRAPACSVPDFAAIDDLGIASDMHLLIHLHGIATGPVCAPE